MAPTTLFLSPSSTLSLPLSFLLSSSLSNLLGDSPTFSESLLSLSL
jgi:hypothetical protein